MRTEGLNKGLIQKLWEIKLYSSYTLFPLISVRFLFSRILPAYILKVVSLRIEGARKMKGRNRFSAEWVRENQRDPIKCNPTRYYTASEQFNYQIFPGLI